jgi:hypothetical protein
MNSGVISGLTAAPLKTHRTFLGPLGSIGISNDAVFIRDGANIISQKNAANSQAFYLYNNATDRGGFQWSANVLNIYTGSGNRALQIGTNSFAGGQWKFGTSFELGFGNLTNSYACIGYGNSADGTSSSLLLQSGARTATWNDSSTAASGTVANRYLIGIAAPTLTATNASVTDTVASTVYIGGAPTASTNTTIGTAYALNVAGGTTTLRNLVPNASLATNMTDGFFNIPGAAGAPSGTPNNTTGFPAYWDSTNLQLYIYTGGAWKKSAAFT